MFHAKSYQSDDKAKLHERLPAIAQDLARKSKRRGITLDSYIISATPYQVLKERYGDGTWDSEKFAEHHILFPDDSLKHIKIILKSGLAKKKIRH